MKTYLSVVLMVVIGSATLLGCDGDAATYELASQPDQASMSPSWVAPKHYTEMEARHKVGAEATALFVEKASDHRDDWSAFDRAVRAHLDEVPSEYRYLADQYLARKALEVLPDTCGEQCDDARRFYTELLLTSGSPDAAVVEEAIRGVEGIWTESEIRAARTKAAENAERWLAAEMERNAKRGKQGCREGDPCFEFADPMMRATARIEAAAHRLREDA